MTTSKELIEMANLEWNNREERKGLHDKISWTSGWINGYLTRNPQAEREMMLDDVKSSYEAMRSDKEKTLDSLRPEVLLFALLMEQKLRKHDKKRGKTGWHFDGEESEGRRYLLSRLKQEVKELEEAMDDCPPFGSFIGEAVDVGNFAMMVSYFDRWAGIHYMISETERELRQGKEE